MDPLTRLLLRMAMWLREPPSRAQLVTIVVVLALVAVLVTIERTIGWPDWARTEHVPIHRM